MSLALWLKDQIRIDALATDANVDGVQTWTAGAIELARVEDKRTVQRQPDGTDVISTLSILCRAPIGLGSRIFVAPLPSSGDGPRKFPAGYAFSDKQFRVPLVVKSASMIGVGRVFEAYF